MHDLKEIKIKELSKADSFELLQNNLDYVLNRISNNTSYATIAKEFNVNIANLCFFLNQESIKEKKEVALQLASYIQIDEAKQYLESIDADDTNASLRKKCELSQFATYLAKVKNRKEFDLNYKSQETQTNNNNIITPQLTLKVINNSDKFTLENND
jgi:arginine utilization protein RocB